MAEHTQIKELQNWLGTGSINIFGRPFSGKDTQSKNLANLFNAEIIGGGDIIRASNNEVVKDSINKGNLAPQQEYLEMVLPYLASEKFQGKPLLLNSLGRWHGEEEPILSAAHNTHHPVKVVIYLDIPESEVWKRWEAAKGLGDRGVRNDDNDTSIKNRLNEFKSKTLPVITYYQQSDLLISVDGTKPHKAVFEAILNQLIERIRKAEQQ